MSRFNLLALLLGLLLVAAPFTRNFAAANDEYDEDEEDGEEEAGEGKDPSEKDVVVLTKANWEEFVGQKKFALVWVGGRRRVLACPRSQAP